MDVNEEIVVKWLNLCKNQFTISNIQFKTIGPKGGSNYSDIDILAADSDGNYYDYEIKWRSVYSIGATDKETVEAYVHQMRRTERVKKIREVIGNKPVKKIFVTTRNHFGKKEEKRKLIESRFTKNNISVIYFEEIIKELVEKISVTGRYDSNILQTIRILKYFDLVK
ncbi:MAG: hypothetical protein ABIE94_03295 [archaeon]